MQINHNFVLSGCDLTVPYCVQNWCFLGCGDSKRSFLFDVRQTKRGLWHTCLGHGCGLQVAPAVRTSASHVHMRPLICPQSALHGQATPTLPPPWVCKPFPCTTCRKEGNHIDGELSLTFPQWIIRHEGTIPSMVRAPKNSWHFTMFCFHWWKSKNHCLLLNAKLFAARSVSGTHGYGVESEGTGMCASEEGMPWQVAWGAVVHGGTSVGWCKFVEEKPCHVLTICVLLCWPK